MHGGIFLLTHIYDNKFNYFQKNIKKLTQIYMCDPKVFLNFLYIYIYMEPCYLSIYIVHPCPFSCWSVRPWGFFSSSLCLCTPLAAMKLEGHSVVTDDLRHHCHTFPSALLALTVVSFYDVNFANSYEYICYTSSSSFLPSSNSVSAYHLHVFEDISSQLLLVFAIFGHPNGGICETLCGPLCSGQRDV